MKAVALIALLLLACRADGVDQPQTTETVRDTPAPASIQPPSDTVAALSDHERELLAAAERVMEFLRGSGSFDAIDIADTVAFHLPDAAGGGRTRVPADALREYENWRVRAEHGHVYPLAPPRSLDALTMRVGRHLRCWEHELASSFPELAGRPHVGTMLQPREPESCLQAWNLTLIFDERRTRPRLVAAAYDQWEW